MKVLTSRGAASMRRLTSAWEPETAAMTHVSSAPTHMPVTVSKIRCAAAYPGRVGSAISAMVSARRLHSLILLTKHVAEW